jgi:hypothetical protein
MLVLAVMIAIIVPVVVIAMVIVTAIIVPVIIPARLPEGNGARKQGQRGYCRCPKSKYEEFSSIHMYSPTNKDVSVPNLCFKVKKI